MKLEYTDIIKENNDTLYVSIPSKINKNKLKKGYNVKVIIMYEEEVEA